MILVHFNDVGLLTTDIGECRRCYFYNGYSSCNKFSHPEGSVNYPCSYLSRTLDIDFYDSNRDHIIFKRVSRISLFLSSYYRNICPLTIPYRLT